MNTPKHFQVAQDPPTFTKLNEGWNAEPNAPYLTLNEKDGVLIATVVPNAFQFSVGSTLKRWVLRFSGCAAYRETIINDHGWYLGQCRFSQIAPAWGEFYELTGNTYDALQEEPWIPMSGSGDRHFHFYLRDSTLEVKADDWQLIKDEENHGYV